MKNPMISYSINGEDVVLARVFSDIPSGFYVDVGANDPTAGSNTRHFYDQGWRGINLEPGRIFTRLAEARPRDINLNIAASSSSGEMVLHEYHVGHGLSSLEVRNPDVSAHYLEGMEKRKVRVRTLRDIFAEFQPPQIDFMSIDVEGHERDVILGNDWSRWRPRVVFLEATLEGRNEPGHHLWEGLILDAGYQFAYYDGLNRFYLRNEDRHLLARFHPPCVFDQYVPRLLAAERAHHAAVAAEHEAYRQELERIKAGLGARSLAFGLAVARALNGILKLPGRLLGRNKAA
jgi:FkbM family methyltransferase